MSPTNRPMTLHRRALLTGSAALATAAGLSGCSVLSTDPSTAGSEPPAVPEGKEAPDLAAQVEAGTLPPLEERLPTEPLTIQPVERLGVYGGTWTSVIAGAADSGNLARTIEYDNLVVWDREWTEVTPNIAKSFSVDDDGRSFTFVLREGMRWSDGEPFTADDIVFAFEDVLYNDEIYPAGAPSRYTNEDGSPARIEKLDDHQLRITFAEPHGFFLDEMATPSGREPTIFPRHHLEQFHADYNDEAAKAAKDEGFDRWADRFLAVSNFRETAEVPTLYAWYLTVPVGEGGKVKAVRNPFYFKVDPQGRQLPYLDKVEYDVIENIDTILLKATNGDFNFHTRHFNDLENKPVVAKGREKGGYDFVEMVPSTNNEMVIMLNLTHQDKGLREVFQSKDFRVGLSHAINREEIINAVFQRQGRPSQPAPRPESAFYDEEFATQFLEYDVDQANTLIDQAGFTRRNDDGIRLGPTGKPISFTVEVPTPTLKSTWVPAMDLIAGYWKEAGIDVEVRGEDRALWTERITANQHDATVWVGEGGNQDAILYGFYYLPYHAGSRFAIDWVNWYTSDGESGTEPPAEVRHQLELYDELMRTVDEAERTKLFTEILQIAKEQFYDIGLIQIDEEYGIVANDFHNVPKSMPFAYLYPTPAPSRPEQYFISTE